MPSQPSKLWTINQVEINDGSRGTYNTNSQIKSKTSILKSSLYDYSDAYILAKGTVTVPNMAVTPTTGNNGNIMVIER